MAEVSRIHRFHLPTTTTYATVADDDDDEEYPNPFAFDFDSLSPPPNHTFFNNFNYSPNSGPGSVHSDLDSENSFYVDEDQMNFVTDLFVTEDPDFDNRNPNSRVFPFGDFGSDFDGDFLPSESNVFNNTGDGLRVVGMGSDSDSDSEELNSRVIDQNLNEDFEWEEVNERVEDRDFLSSVIDGIEEISVSSDISSSINGGDDEPVRNLEWEVLLAVNNIERSLDFDGNDDTEYGDALFGQFLESEGTLMKGSPPAAKSVVENLPFVVLKDEENKMACAVCKDEILVVEKVTELPCSHYYHWDCIVPWLNIRNTCPVCRHELPTDDNDYERRKNGTRTGVGTGLVDDFQMHFIKKYCYRCNFAEINGRRT
ncbi:uncharacterized protein LOC107795337 isoform X1 [Nicotiana tabacum]|uniref:Uncharacterized protein LOC107795337 isoform X1 n=1 Tax=Nicotiana tabacum TaxID=4097 RepID=A0AC58SZS9_TOBAC